MINLDNKVVLSEDASTLPEFDTIEAAVGESIMEINEQALYENEANWNAIETYIEQRQLQEAVNKQDYLLSEGFVGDFFNQVKEWIVALYRKVVALFKKFISMMDSLILSDKEFVKKYQGELSKVTLKDSFKISGYKFSVDKVNLSKTGIEEVKNTISKKLECTLGDSDITNITDKTTAALKSYSDDSESVMEGFTADVFNKIAGKSQTSMTTKEFRDELFEALRSGNKSKETLGKSDISIGTQISTILSYKDAKTKAEKEMKEIKKMCDDFTKMCDKLQTNLANSEKAKTTGQYGDTYQQKIRVAHIACGYGKKLLVLSQTANALILSALKSENRQAKAICVKALTQSKESFKEDANIEIPSTLAMPKLI